MTASIIQKCTIQLSYLALRRYPFGASRLSTSGYDKYNRKYSIAVSNPANIQSQSKTERSRRALFNVPGSEERKLKASLRLKADSIVFDLEDGVAMNRKGAARQMVFDALETFDLGKLEKAVRINAIGTGMEIDDLNVILRSSKLQCIVIPKVQSPKDIEFVSQMIESAAPDSSRHNIRLIACIESALGIMNLKEIASCNPKLDALVFASEDYCADTGMIRTPSRKELMYARSAVVTAACAYGLQAIDLVCLDYKDGDILKEESREGREMGFTGKQAIHPAQVDIIQQVYSPSPAEIEKATQIVRGYQEHTRKGVGAFNLDGKMVDMPVVKWAERLLAKAEMM